MDKKPQTTSPPAQVSSQFTLSTNTLSLHARARVATLMVVFGRLLRVRIGCTN